MSCLHCQRRAALIAALAPAISHKRLSRESLLGLLALPDEQLLHSARVKDPGELLRRLRISPPSERLPAALCAHDPGYPQTLAQLDCAPAVLHGTCTTERLPALAPSTLSLKKQKRSQQRPAFFVSRHLGRKPNITSQAVFLPTPPSLR